jgi:predicted AAA+ superfamily ATPase
LTSFLTPYSSNIGRAILKEPKLYFFDNALVQGDEGVRFENLVALCLYKSVLYRRDQLAEEIELKYIRTKDKKEIDFTLVKQGTTAINPKTTAPTFLLPLPPAG